MNIQIIKMITLVSRSESMSKLLNPAVREENAINAEDCNFCPKLRLEKAPFHSKAKIEKSSIKDIIAVESRTILECNEIF